MKGETWEDMYLDVMTDSDWAGCLATRKSTSGGIASMMGGMLKSWSSTQGSVAMSSGEAEHYALVKAASEALGMQALAADLGGVARCGCGLLQRRRNALHPGAWASPAPRGSISVASGSGEERPRDHQEGGRRKESCRYPDEAQKCCRHDGEAGASKR